jgi:hypothetical protein
MRPILRYSIQHLVYGFLARSGCCPKLVLAVVGDHTNQINPDRICHVSLCIETQLCSSRRPPQLEIANLAMPKRPRRGGAEAANPSGVRR